MFILLTKYDTNTQTALNVWVAVLIAAVTTAGFSVNIFSSA